MKPGRLFDRRYRRVARDEVMNFFERQLQEDLRHGNAEIRVTTMPGLRGGQSQVHGNLFAFSSGTTTKLQSEGFRSSHQVSGNGYVNGAITDRSGNPRRRTVSGRFG